MSRRRDQRKAKALAYLQEWKRASALDLGNAAVSGETAAKFIPRRHREKIGLSIGVMYVRRGFACTTRSNNFEWVRK
jgi:hypothetical protein